MPFFVCLPSALNRAYNPRFEMSRVGLSDDDRLLEEVLGVHLFAELQSHGYIGYIWVGFGRARDSERSVLELGNARGEVGDQGGGESAFFGDRRSKLSRVVLYILRNVKKQLSKFKT